MSNQGTQLIIVGVAAAAIYFLLKKQFDKAKDALANVGSAIGSGLYDMFHGNVVGETLFYNVGFPNKTRHAVPSSTVNQAGQFMFALPPQVARKYQMLTGRDGLRYAAPV